MCCSYFDQYNVRFASDLLDSFIVDPNCNLFELASLCSTPPNFYFIFYLLQCVKWCLNWQNRQFVQHRQSFRVFLMRKEIFQTFYEARLNALPKCFNFRYSVFSLDHKWHAQCQFVIWPGQQRFFSGFCRKNLFLFLIVSVVKTLAKVRFFPFVPKISWLLSFS